MKDSLVNIRTLSRGDTVQHNGQTFEFLFWTGAPIGADAFFRRVEPEGRLCFRTSVVNNGMRLVANLDNMHGMDFTPYEIEKAHGYAD